ncbi:MAG: hypothetical protein DU489_07100 [Nitrosomonas sp.]|uniref:hypothetical protein n=1 Tax=Nitrosomonas sp. TaxID=42353 RepID=UPI0032F06889
MSNRLLIDQEILKIQAKIEEASKALAEYKIVLKYLEQRRDEDGAEIVSGDNKSDEINPLDEFFPTSEKKPNFPDKIREIYSQLGDREFEVPNIAFLMQKKGIITEIDNNIKAKISTILAHDTKRGKLIRTFQGQGNTPHKYKIVGSAQGQLLVGEAESQKNEENSEGIIG